MAFSSITFLFFFLPLTMLAYFVVPRRARTYVILCANIVFFLWAEPLSLMILVCLVLVNYLCGLSIYRYRSMRKKSRIPLMIGLSINILTLLIFKYHLFVPAPVGDLMRSQDALRDLIVPLGISVYVLQGISYLVDLYFHKVQVQKKFALFAMYQSFFPQMICGPVVRYGDVRVSLSLRQTNHNTISKGYGMFIRGLAKKVLLADVMLELWNTVNMLDYVSISLLTAWFGVIAFAYAVYFYFSGYSDMARGIAKIMGFEFPINFNYPFISRSIMDFWRRWNISLTTWYKTYLITPLGKNRNSFFLTLFKVLVIWMLMGLWYGSQANYLIWGIYIAFLIIIEKLFFSSVLDKLPHLLQRVYTSLLLLIGWVIFANQDLARIPRYFRAMFTGNTSSPAELITNWNTAIADTTFFYLAGSYGVIFLICVFAASNMGHNMMLRREPNYPKTISWVRISWEIVLTVFCAVAVIAGRGTDLTFFVNF